MKRTAVVVAIVAAVLLLVALVFGADHVLAKIAVFFSKLAVVTFGGAYAVLAYVAQQAADYYHLVQPREIGRAHV